MKRYLLLLSAIFNIALTSYLSVIRPFGMLDQKTISELYTTLITPAGITFSIWSIIYTSWFFLGVYILRYPKKIKKKSVHLLVLAQTLSTLWLIPSQLGYIAVSFAVMIGLFITLAILLRKKQKNTYVSGIIQLFFGWILVACIANFHQTLVYFGIYFNPVILSIISIILGTLIVRNILKQYSQFIPSIVFIWALGGILIGQDDSAILITAGIAILFLSVTLGATFLKSQQKL